jgi:hypothetical protein
MRLWRPHMYFLLTIWNPASTICVHERATETSQVAKRIGEEEVWDGHRQGAGAPEVVAAGSGAASGDVAGTAEQVGERGTHAQPGGRGAAERGAGNPFLGAGAGRRAGGGALSGGVAGARPFVHDDEPAAPALAGAAAPGEGEEHEIERFSGVTKAPDV